LKLIGKSEFKLINLNCIGDLGACLLSASRKMHFLCKVTCINLCRVSVFGAAVVRVDKNSSGDEIANVNFFTTSHM